MKEMMSGTEWYFYGIGGQKLLTKFCDGVPFVHDEGYNVYFGGKLLKSKGAVVATDRWGVYEPTTMGSSSDTTRMGRSGHRRPTIARSSARTRGIA